MSVPCRGAKFDVHVAGAANMSGGLVFLLHGAGFTGMSWAPLVDHLKQLCCCVAPDLRAHGGTTTADDTDLAASTLVSDALELLNALLQQHGTLPPLRSTAQPQQHQPPVRVLLVGHSLGGAIAVRMAAHERTPQQRSDADTYCIGGVVCIDVAEGTALASLPHMAAVIASMPQSFATIDDAIAWHLKSGSIRSAAAARVTVPSRLVLASCEREGEGEGGGVYKWRTDLACTERFWEGWFMGLSSAFINLRIPKLLIVAGMDRLDTELTVGQIQGKFQLKLVYGAGHSVHEDQPQQVASHVLAFARHFGILNVGSPQAEQDELRAKLERARNLGKPPSGSGGGS
ncbi:putative protein phosphatase methylesterase [Tribonema minus]|uniref:Protein phosphatase methylesterase 1 n=1 Tax=Tribonema minus TaxID=303371 RepID=A0A835YP78_9STRA|nr:putative protein phosphatase methylesterase [Tribonema minus]